MKDSIDISKDLEVAKYIIENNDLFYYNQSFYEYNTNHWQPISFELIKKIILDILEDQYKQNRVNNIIDILRIKTSKSKDEINQIDKLRAINIINGHYYLDNKKLIPHSDETKFLYSTNVFSIKFNVNAKCDRWNSFVNEIFLHDPDRVDKIELLQEYLGYCLTQNTLFQKALLMLGTGSNGKSIIIQVMQKILGNGNYSNIELHQFSKPTYVVELQNMLVNFCSEIDHKNKFSSGVFKRIVTGETLTGDAKFQHPIKFEPYCKLIFASNDLPVTNDTTKGYFRRLLILKFNRSFDGKDRDDNLINILYSEIDGIFIWILQGLERLHKRKCFTIPESHKIELINYLLSSNSVVSFVNENCEITTNDDAWERYDDLYQAYRVHSIDSGTRAFTKQNFKKEILNHFPNIPFAKTGDRGRHFKNLKIQK